MWHIKSCNVTINYIDIKTFNVISITRDINYHLKFNRLRTLNIDYEVEQSDAFRRLHKKWAVTCTVMYYMGAGKSLDWPTSWCIFFDGENISFDANIC